MAVHLTRYWMEVQLPEGQLHPRHFGVTAYSLDDALSLLHASAAYTLPTPPVVVQAWPEIDVSTLDLDHVLPNMLPPNRRGVWFPIT
ncbi:hypothetical protein [Hymenobacter siberiensis]|uniref:hypothetical protein n=1 Tax=Hymenobacter siberiensis TaxID=2848396 RepID=UPI001C1DF823|nr:hypothetical protein [Hymenobacter siberiensis]MBU6122593.1 hypothetical protein [Hymenobacter siberiensis]